ncbi:PPP family 3-phenylpropionic acid transporter [Hoeflea marina]|uniref:PPP family 3-phenylpropionic acid transporter n=1 Tax=Hoeflea marina TaxID=274592 RepID=A0A317PY24_9HYPH|nr:MFS transporter [Hoeflea marina]PWW04410.1 PPP family 3-phenylpropionic acid transporter [Hoeflea marina]
MSTPQFAATRYYLSAYLSVAVTVTYLPIWLNDKGVSDAQIGLINTVPMFALLLTSVFFGRIADRAPDWKLAIMIGTAVAAVASLLLGLADGFWLILVVWTLTIVPAGLAGPVADAATMRMSLRRGFSFGTTRAWGTVGYLLMCFVTGYFVQWRGPDAFVWLFAVACFVRFGMAWLLPPMRDVDAERNLSGGRLLSRRLIESFEPWVLLPIFAGAILFANHMVMNAFSSLVWKEQGISGPVIGTLIAIGGAAEAATMFGWRRINLRFSARHLILVGAVAAVARWAVMALSPPVWVLVILQMGQAVTFTFAYLGCLYFITKRTEESVAAEAQSLFGVMQQAASIIVVSLFGLAFGLFGAQAFWGTAALSVLAIGLVMISLNLRAPDSAG